VREARRTQTGVVWPHELQRLFAGCLHRRRPSHVSRVWTRRRMT